MSQVSAAKRSLSDDDESLVVPEKKGKNEGENDAVKNRIKCDKYAMLVSFCGQGFYGMQINGDMPTIERELLNALSYCNLIDDEDCRKPGGKLCFQRAARTDKNVSAVKQVCSLKLPRSCQNELNTRWVDAVNKRLPDGIRIWGFIRSTQGFNAKTSCDGRTYAYTLPTVALAPSKDIFDESFRVSQDQLYKANEILSMFKGTQNFHNFTFGKKPDDRSCIRYVVSCSCGEPFIVDGVQFVTITIRGQSFMIHQIRKIVGLTIAVLRSFAQPSIVQEALSSKRKVDVPKAPGLGLVLQEVHYDWYNRRYEKTHEPLMWSQYQEKVDKFLREHITKRIIDSELKEKSMIEWLKVLYKHSFCSSDNEEKMRAIEDSREDSRASSEDEPQCVNKLSRSHTGGAADVKCAHSTKTDL